jgi:hypothetical protein
VIHHVLQIYAYTFEERRNWDGKLTHIFGTKFKMNAPLVKIVCSCGINEGAVEGNNM